MLKIEVIHMGKHFFSSKNDLDEKNNQSSVNEKNSLEYQNLMDHSRKTYDDYWDINSPIIRIILIILFLIIVVGVGYYFVMWFRTR